MVPTVANWNQTGDEFSLILDQNPLTDFVELPEDHPNLLYSNILCGVIRGALEMVSAVQPPAHFCPCKFFLSDSTVLCIIHHFTPQ